MDAAEVCESDAARYRWLRAVSRCGIAFLCNAPIRDGFVLELAALVGYVRETNYGRIFDVRSIPNPNNLAYSDRGLGLHTDNPYRDPVPGLQALHCLVASETGGESLFADRWAAAASLRDKEPEVFAILARTPVRFAFEDADAALSAAKPLIQLDLTGEVKAIRYNNRSIAPLRPAPRCFASIRPIGALLGVCDLRSSHSS
jgi:gamma-butyrobetaine dioxygenase